MGGTHIPAAELAVLEGLWRLGSVTIRQLTDEIYPGGLSSDYATVQKLISRLEQKGCVRRDRTEFVHRLAATIDRTALIDQQLQDVAERLCEGSWTPLLMHLVQGSSLSQRDRQQLRDFLDDPARRAKARRKR